MALHRLRSIEIGVPEPALAATRAFYRLALSVGVDDADDLGRAAAAAMVRGAPAWGPPVPRQFLAPDDIMALARGR